MLQLLLCFQALLPNPRLMLFCDDLGLPDLLLPDAILLIDLSQIIHGESAFWEASMEHLKALHQSQMGPLADNLRISQIGDLSWIWPLGELPRGSLSSQLFPCFYG